MRARDEPSWSRWWLTRTGMLTQKPATSTYPTEDAANEPATTIAELEQALVETTGGALQTGAVLSRIAVMMVGSE